MNKRLILFSMLAAVAVVLGTGCQRDPIVYPTSDYYLALSIKGADPNAPLPPFVLVTFYNTSTNTVAYSTFIQPNAHPKDMPPGGYIPGIAPGEYNLLVYNTDLTTITVQQENRYDRIFAESVVYSRAESAAIIYAPNPFYVYSEPVSVPYITVDDGVYIINAELNPEVEQWTLIVEGIRHLERAVKIQFLLSGQTQGKWLGPVRKLPDAGIVLFEGNKVQYETPPTPETTYYIRTLYTTFGKVESDQRVLLTMIIEGPGGSMYYGQVEVTDQVLAEQDRSRTIYVRFDDIDIEEREQGGLNPAVDPWDPKVIVIILQ